MNESESKEFAGETMHERYCHLCEEITNWMCGSSGWGNNCNCYGGCEAYYRRDGRYGERWPPQYMFVPPEERKQHILTHGLIGILNHKDWVFNDLSMIRLRGG